MGGRRGSYNCHGSNRSVNNFSDETQKEVFLKSSEV